MTSRVFDCRPQAAPPPIIGRPRPERRAPKRGFRAATLTALIVVPLAGAAEPPQGWAAATVAALTILLLLPMLGGGAPWGWFGVLTAVTAMITPRGQLTSMGPALFVATVLCGVLWLANRRSAGRGPEQRPRPGSPYREAQVLMGLTGERHVSEVLAHELPEEYVVINGLKLPHGAGDVDHIVVGPSGVFFLETKTMAGRIECDAQGNWRRTRVGRGGELCPAYIGNPSAQVQRNIFAARQCLRRRTPALFTGLPLWIEGLVVFPHPRTELDTEHSRVPAVRLEHAVQHICAHTPRRALQPSEIDAIVEGLLAEGAEQPLRLRHAAQSAQALVEAALALPIVLGILFGIVAVSRLVQAETAVIAVAHEAARAATLASGPQDAVGRMRRRVDLVAPGLGLDPHSVQLEWDVSTFDRDQGHVVAVVSYTVDLHDLPLAGWAPSPTVRAQHVEWVDPFRSGLLTNSDGSR